ncbi:cysteine protease family C01A [Achlya hypogyna]|uniref:Cysteine protease family C01A n=1 Tax=Achlya hypogyna TaxID=1202772 RepID=A0A1V9YXP9_ACHHY|nr:cysteine protease family C01A [Achlya hypogyna]
MHRIVFASVAAASIVAIEIPAAERAQLHAELIQWEADFGELAAKNGLLAFIEGLSPDAATEAKLRRLHAAKAKVAAVQTANPSANFSVQTQFGLLSSSEFSAYLQKSFGKRPTRKLRTTKLAAQADAPSSIDWTTSKCVGPIKDQGQCGSCWAFSAAGAAEMGNCIAGGQLYDLSEQQLVDCDTSDGRACNGGFEDNALNWLVAQGGLCLESDYPYTSGTTRQAGSCNMSCQKQALPLIGDAVSIQGESALTTALGTQPVMVAVFAGNDAWQYYTGGVMSSCPAGHSDHAVIAVGYGSDGSDYYKIRNSWGTSWGEAGYIRLQRNVGGDGTCNVAGQAAFPQLKASSGNSNAGSASSSWGF